MSRARRDRLEWLQHRAGVLERLLAGIEPHLERATCELADAQVARAELPKRARAPVPEVSVGPRRGEPSVALACVAAVLVLPLLFVRVVTVGRLP